ncbi:MAG TPA: hypothetical protein VF881_03595 [Polyangiaceae bacterium]
MHLLPAQRVLLAISICLLCLSASACANRQDVLVSKRQGHGAARVYPVTVDQAWSISKTILHLEATDAIEEHRPEGYLLTSQDMGPLSAGTYIGIFVEAEGARASKVTFVARRRTPTQAYAAITPDQFHKKFAELLDLVASVGALAAPRDADAGDAADAGAVEAGRD